MWLLLVALEKLSHADVAKAIGQPEGLSRRRACREPEPDLKAILAGEREPHLKSSCRESAAHPIAEEDLHAYDNRPMVLDRRRSKPGWPRTPNTAPGRKPRREQPHACIGYSIRCSTSPSPRACCHPQIASRWLTGVALPLSAGRFWAAWLAFAAVCQHDTAPTLNGGSLPHLAAVAHAVHTPEVRHPVEVGADQRSSGELVVQAPPGRQAHPTEAGDGWLSARWRPPAAR